MTINAIYPRSVALNALQPYMHYARVYSRFMSKENSRVDSSRAIRLHIPISYFSCDFWRRFLLLNLEECESIHSCRANLIMNVL